MMWLIAGWTGCSTPSTPPEDDREGPVLVRPAELDPRWDDARCNDGTPFGYTLLRADPDLWIINLAGGFFCDDERAPCAKRKRRFVTTVPSAEEAAQRLPKRGLFGRDPVANPVFAGATLVHAHYCSSDLWLGGSTTRQPTTGDPSNGWYFSGRANVAALIESLQAHQGLDDAQARILLLGTSAGGAGVVGNLEAIQERLPQASASGRLRVVLDGSWVPAQPEGTELPNAAKWGPVHRACDRDQRDRGKSPVHCIYGEVWWPYVAATPIPVLVQLSGLDTSQTPVFGVQDASRRAAWQARTQASLRTRSGSRAPWVYSGGHAYHTVALQPLYDKGPPGRSFRTMLERFWSSPFDAKPQQVWFRYADVAPVNGATPGK